MFNRELAIVVSGLLLLFIIVGSAGYFVFLRLAELEGELAKQQNQTAELSDILTTSLAESQVLINTLSGNLETSRQALAEQEVLFSSQISSLEKARAKNQQLINQTNELLQTDLSTLQEKVQVIESRPDIQTLGLKWSRIVSQLTCKFEEEQDNHGSGTYFGSNFDVSFGRPVILTNEHVVDADEEEIRTHCQADFWTAGASTTVISNNDYELIGQLDAAIADTPADFDPASLGLASSYQVCSDQLAIGEEIVVLGYPKIGSPEGITLTEGIISGYDEEFYIISAKIDKGNSGGAAVSLAHDCYFGIPTLVQKGQIESLGRVLDIRTILEMDGEEEVVE